MNKKKLQSFKGGEVVRNSSLLTALSSLTNGGNMKRIIIKRILTIFLVTFVILIGCKCESVDYSTVEKCIAPNWTSDGKVVYVKEKTVWKTTHTVTGDRTVKESRETWLYEINADGTGKTEKGVLLDNVEQMINSSSSAGDWVVFDNVIEISNITNLPTDGEIYVVKRNGSELSKVGNGLYPDFSPDAEKIVYEKKDNGIWVMDRDGSGDHQIISEEDARYPAWSSDGGRIGYTSSDSLGIFIADTIGTIILVWKGDSIRATGSKLDWAPLDSNSIIIRGKKDEDYGFVVLKMDSLHQCSFTKFHNGFHTFYYKWSPNGNKLIAHDENGWFVANMEGTNKWYLKP